jgi:hypothetical protein
VLAIGFVGAALTRLRPRGMLYTLLAMAAAHVAIAAVAIALRLGGGESGPLEIVEVNGFFVALFTASALLFRTAARVQPGADGGAAMA